MPGDDDTTAEFWSAVDLARNDPALKDALERLKSQLGEEPSLGEDPTLSASLLPGDVDRLGGSLSRVLGRGLRAPADDPPRDRVLEPVPDDEGAGYGSRITLSLPPDEEEPTVAEDPDEPERPKRRPKAPTEVEPAQPAHELEGSFDEVRREVTDPNGLLGPVDEFTLSLKEEVVKAALAREQRPAPSQAPRTPTPAPKVASRVMPPPRTGPAPADPLTTGVVAVPGHGPLTTGVVHVPSDVFREPAAAKPPGRGAIGEGTAALMYDGLDDLSLGSLDQGFDEAEDSDDFGLPEVAMPPPDTARARPLQAPTTRGDVSNRPQAQESRPARDFEERSPRAPMEPRPPRPDPLRPPLAARPAARPKTSTPTPAEPRPEAAAPLEPLPVAPRGRPTAPDTAAVKRLEELLTFADEPPEREETLSTSLELLSYTEAPPNRDETIGGDLELVGGVPDLPRISDDPPAGEETLSHALIPVSEPSSDDLQLPPAVSPAQRRTASDLGNLETRPLGPDPSRQALPPPSRAAPTPQSQPRQVPSSAHRREVYRPTAAATPAPEPLPVVPDAPTYQDEPILVWITTVVTVIGGLVFVLFLVGVIVLITS